ncbi:hypothetical protein SUDANB120_00291 [Streptomyces sp. enrichment culture]|uniref:hypothetical protein n=1 Tax=Streptomyces TaxID=1883 RepID=UPI0016771EF5|nr:MULTISPECIES: hypothetical protein [Streptomyces]MBD3578088.1 hypothetical protein [Streptomyces sp. KD18]GGT02179.1 hypothetical protein GCM10010286_28920 [Streptomyces toxytricini]
MAEPDVELLAAALRRDSADLDLYAQVLTANLAASLPAGTVRVRRRRSLAQRVAGHEGSVEELDIALGEQRLALRTERGRVVAEALHEVRGVVLSRRRVGLDEWVDALARSLARAAVSDARAREALERFLG